VLLALIGNAWVGRLLLVLGRRQEALRLLEETQRRAEAMGAVGVVRTVYRSREEDALTQVGRRDTRAIPDTRRSVAARARALAALRAAAEGNSLAVAGLLESFSGLAVGPDYALERALAHLARGLLARLEGRSADSRTELEQAVRAAAEGSADADTIPKLTAALGQVSVITPGTRRLSDEAPTQSPGSVVLDGRNHELRVGDKVVSLKRRVLPRRLMYALARRPGQILTKDECAQALWGREYNPLVHDNPLRVNVRYVRTLLEGSGLVVEFEDPGYRLKAPEHFVFLSDAEESS
jgi:DNA-binding winged helix-turn-helix (wHTH) protein